MGAGEVNESPPGKVSLGKLVQWVVQWWNADAGVPFGPDAIALAWREGARMRLDALRSHAGTMQRRSERAATKALIADVVNARAFRELKRWRACVVLANVCLDNRDLDESEAREVREAFGAVRAWDESKNLNGLRYANAHASWLLRFASAMGEAEFTWAQIVKGGAR